MEDLAVLAFLGLLDRIPASPTSHAVGGKEGAATPTGSTLVPTAWAEAREDSGEKFTNRRGATASHGEFIE